MVKNKTLKLTAAQEFIAFANEINQPCDVILKQVSEALRFIPYPYEEELKQGTPVSKVIMEIFDLVPVGYRVDRQLKKALKIDGFVMDDCDISLEDRYFFFDYTATKEAEVNLDSLYVIIDNDGATLTCHRSVKKERVNRIKELIEDFEDELLDHYESYKFEIGEDPEYPTINLDIQAETLGYLPDTHQLSALFDRIEKEASTTL